jgi:hypothetical protein
VERVVLPTPAPCSATLRALRVFRWRLRITPATRTENPLVGNRECDCPNLDHFRRLIRSVNDHGGNRFQRPCVA